MTENVSALLFQKLSLLKFFKLFINKVSRFCIVLRFPFCLSCIVQYENHQEHLLAKDGRPSAHLSTQSISFFLIKKGKFRKKTFFKILVTHLLISITFYLMFAFI